MEKSLPFDFAVILPDNNGAQQVSSRYNGSCTTSDDFPVGCQRIPMYKVQINGLLGIITAIPGHTQQAVSVLLQILSSAVPRCNTFLFSTAVSCGCVKTRRNELISIDTLYGTSSETVVLKFYLPKGAEKAYPATAVSKCGHNSGSSRKRLQLSQCKVQALVSLDIPVDAVPADIILIAVNVNKIPCSYKQADVKKSLFNDEYSQALIDTVTAFIPDIMVDPHLVSLPLTPPQTCKKQKSIKPLCDKDNQFINLFPYPTTTEEYSEQKSLIDKFVNGHVIMELHPDSYQNFARCLGLNDAEYALIKHDYSGHELIYQTIRKWFSKEGCRANVKNFCGALETHKGLQHNFLFYCKEYHEP